MKFRKTGIPIILVLCGVLPLVSCADRKITPPRQFSSWTSDVIFLDSVRCLMDRSPLQKIKGYEKFLPIGVTWTDPAYPPGTTGETDKKYAAIWTLADSTLCLTAIDGIRTNPRVVWSTRYIPAMKEILIDKDALDKKEVTPDTTPIVATWVSGKFYVKQAVDKPWQTVDLGTWRKSSFKELTFEKGKLISVREIETLPVTPEDEISFKKKEIEMREKRKDLMRYMRDNQVKYLDFDDGTIIIL